LDAALEAFRTETEIPEDNITETCCADDTDYISLEFATNLALLPFLKDVLANWNLLINTAKTAHIVISKTSKPKTRKLGSRMDPTEDFKVRIIADGNKASKSLTSLWRSKEKFLNIQTKLDTYRTYILFLSFR